MTRRLTRTTAALIAGGVLAVLVATGLGVVESSASSGPMIPANPLVAAKSATAFARDLLREAPLPKGALAMLQPAGFEDAIGRPAWNYLVDVHAAYEVPLPFNLGAFLRSHDLDGATLSGPESASGTNIDSVTGYAVSLPIASRHVSYEQLDYTDGGAKPGLIDLRVDAQVVWLPITTVTMPTTSPVTLTAYNHVSLATGPSGAVSIPLSTIQARHLEHVVAALSSAGGGECMENSPMFVITTTTPSTKSGAKEHWTGTAQECPAVLEVVSGSRHVLLDDSSCALRSLVLSDLPKGKATATRVALRGDCSK